jgi:hypothetical protein
LVASVRNLRMPFAPQFAIFPSMHIDSKALQYWIDNFYGYGSWHAKIWFVGYEDGGGEWPEEVAEKLHYFYNTHTSKTEAKLCDIRELYQQITARLEGPRGKLFANLFEHRFGKQAIQHGVWKNLIGFAHGYRNATLPDLLEFQKNSFLSATSQEAWIQLYPLPSPHSHAWYYAWLDLPGLDFIRRRAQYQEHLYPNRIQHILNNIKEYKPEIVLMYSMENISGLKESVREFFSDATFKTVKAIKLQTPQYHRADINGTTLIITTQMPALHHNRIETGFDWYGFGKLVNDKL